MTDDIKRKATDAVRQENDECAEPKVSDLYDNIMGGTVATVAFERGGKEEKNHVYVGQGEVRVFKKYSALLNAIGHSRERNGFLRFVEMVGIGGVIAFILVIFFAALLLVLTLTDKANASVLEVVKLSLTSILGFFFGQAKTGGRSS